MAEGSDENDTWIMGICRDVEEDVVLDPDCPTFAHQALKDIYADPTLQKLTLDELDDSRAVNVLTNAGRLVLKLVATSRQGAVVLNDNGHLMLVRGSMFYDRAQPPNDSLGEAAVSKLFDDGNLPASYKLSRLDSVPMLAAKGQLVIGGHLAVSRAFTKVQLRDAIQDGDIGGKVLMERQDLTVLGKEQTIYWNDKTSIIPDAITRILS